MIHSTEFPVFPQSYRVLSGSALKTLALTAMLCDHIAKVLLKNIPAMTTPLFTLFGSDFTVYFFMISFGRIAFPIYAFLITEGCRHTRDRRRYCLGLLCFALLSEVPWNLVHFNTVFSLQKQNVFFTLFLGSAAICLCEKFSGDIVRRSAVLISLAAFAYVLRCDYGLKGFAFILAVYILRPDGIMQAVIGACLLSAPLRGGMAFIPINMYNGERGYIGSKPLKYVFYAVYPVHMLILWFLKLRFFGY